jgi:uncharacterized Zn-binding protein involved in type VI secretion
VAETRHVANASSQWRAVCDEPDYCRVGKRIVAFQSHALLDPWQRASTDVKAQSLPVYRQGDLLRGMLADNGRHIVSGTSLGSGHVLILEGQQDVKVNGVPVARHDSACRVNCDASGAGGARGFLQVCTKDAAQADAEGHGSNSFARQALDAAQERYALHASGEAPLMPQQSLALRAEINRLSQIVNPGSHNLWGDYSAAEKAYLAQKAADQRRAMNNVGMSAGGLLAIGGWIARLFNAREEVVEGATEISAGLAGLQLRPRLPRLRRSASAGQSVQSPRNPEAPKATGRGVHVTPKTAPQSREDINFASKRKLDDHYAKHGKEFGANSAEEYLNNGRDIMRTGHRVEYLYKGETRVGYVKFMGNDSRGFAKFGFVGTNQEGFITTIHTQSGKSFWKLLNGSPVDKTIRVAQ